MQNLKVMLIVLGACLLFFACSEETAISPALASSPTDDPGLKSAAKPAAHLYGIITSCDFIETAVGPDEACWDGPIYFEGYGEFGMRAYHLSEFRDYSQVSPFEELWEIYLLDDPDVVVMGGYNSGVTKIANKPPEPVKYNMNTVIEVANPPFEEWQGRPAHQDGKIYWQILTLPDGSVVVLPDYCDGVFRVN